MTTRAKLRIANILFWVTAWLGVIVATDTMGVWVMMAFESVIPIMMGVIIHIAFRENPGSSEMPHQ